MLGSILAGESRRCCYRRAAAEVTRGDTTPDAPRSRHLTALACSCVRACSPCPSLSEQACGLVLVTANTACFLLLLAFCAVTMRDGNAAAKDVARQLGLIGMDLPPPKRTLPDGSPAAHVAILYPSSSSAHATSSRFTSAAAPLRTVETAVMLKQVRMHASPQTSRLHRARRVPTCIALSTSPPRPARALRPHRCSRRGRRCCASSLMWKTSPTEAACVPTQRLDPWRLALPSLC